MDNKKQYSVQDALAVIQGDDSEFEGCEGSSDEDPEDPHYTSSNKDMESDESADSDWSESGALDEVPQPKMNSGQQKTTAQGKKQFSWRKTPFEAPECTFKGQSVKPPDHPHTPLEYFRKFITEEMIELLKEQTNLYSVQNSAQNGNVDTTVKELEILIGVYLRMGLCQLQGNRAYWESDTRCAMVADTMSRCRFHTLLASLHFTDNTDLSKRQEDKCWKIRPWLDMFRKQCLEITPEEHNCITEQMVSFKGPPSPLRQPVKSKPRPWGLKVWGRCTSSGILCDFVVNEGGSGKKTSLGMEGDVVVKLCKTLPSNQNYKVFADNLFSSAPLVLELLRRQIYFTGTLCSNRLAGCQLEDEKSLSKRGRGSVDVTVEKKGSMAIVKWFDKRSVTLISSYCAVEPQDKARCWCKTNKAFVEVNKPHIVKEYNTFTGRIDLLHVYITRYKYHLRSPRWYLYLFWQTIMVGLVNAWLIYRRDCKLLGVQKPLKQRSFQAAVATGLILCPSRDSTFPPPPKRVRVGVPDDVRVDQVAHWPGKCGKQGRCKFCKSKATTTICEKCDVRLCLTEDRNCFKDFHLA